MPMVMKILTIAQNQNTLCYGTIHGGGYQPWIHKFKLGIMCTCNKQRQLFWM
jgi:hypothetical protein